MSKLPKEIIFDNKNYKVNDLGIEIFQRGDASAYHIPEGLICVSNFSGKTEKVINKDFKNQNYIEIKNISKFIINLLSR